LVFGEEAQFPHELGLYIAIFTTPDFMQLGSNALYYGTLGRRVGLFGAPQKKEAKASFFFASEPLHYDRRDIRQQKDILRDKFSGLGTTNCQKLAASAEWFVLPTRIANSITLEDYSVTYSTSNFPADNVSL
jgi:hypothetical protein